MSHKVCINYAEYLRDDWMEVLEYMCDNREQIVDWEIEGLISK